MGWGAKITLQSRRSPPMSVKTSLEMVLAVATRAPYTIVAISIRTSNFVWAHPSRVDSQAVFQKSAAGHPKFGAEREVRASPWEFALIAWRLDVPRVLNKRSFKKKIEKSWGRLKAGFSLV